ncbi:GntR family transcriptional regulator [Pseudomonas sp. PSKL.D1]|uniref:GntR family transcriptional regulator n=1 Tax=Pseudomonas sp. PSKL.D1 TaxID=3029060 RepID=UPI0023812A9B|nr:GntR family transcriptional regulator [Pseudomonas sp. PSKL.D1]WDY55800.1 GntR family transcriptional regulator [Pseudomonas sp. PSKL.D1]
MGELAKIERMHLHDTVLDHLRRFVIEGTLKPGIKINERELCEVLGISRTPLREALKVLAMEGLIELRPNRGARVAQMSDVETREMFELMSGIEAFSGLLACERITDSEIQAIRSLHYQMLQAKASNDLSLYFEKNAAIHDAISQAARNETLRKTYLTLNQRIQAVRYRSNRTDVKWERAIHDHEDMIEALEQRDGERLSAILRSHILDAGGLQRN